MKVHEFYSKFANTPLGERDKPISFKESGMTTLRDIYVRVDELEKDMRPKRIEQDKLLKLAEIYYSPKNKLL